MRYFLDLSFDGSAYHGWQIQANAVTVQEIVNQSLSTLLRTPIEVVGAGRTDTGVHALQLYCHFDSILPIENTETFLYHLNALLPKDIAANSLKEVGLESHARFSAVSRTYIYRIVFNKDPFNLNRAWFYPYHLDIDQMNKACEILKTFNDFSCFSKSNTQTKTNICHIIDAKWQIKNEVLEFSITADRFLRNMVRAIVGTMIEIGRHQLDLAGLEKIIISANRSEAGTSVPAHGLYLQRVNYPEHILNSEYVKS